MRSLVLAPVSQGAAGAESQLSVWLICPEENRLSRPVQSMLNIHYLFNVSSVPLSDARATRVCKNQTSEIFEGLELSISLNLTFSGMISILITSTEFGMQQENLL